MPPPHVPGPGDSPPLHRLLSQAADAVAAVRSGRSLTDALAQVPERLRPGTQALAFQVLRRLGAALAVRQQLAPKPPPPAVEAVLLCALALLWPDDDGRPPPYAAHTLVDQAVAAVRQRLPGAAGFANAVLRRFLREQAALVLRAGQRPESAWNHPAWWIERLRQDWPDHWQALLAQANRQPPMVLRVHARHASAADYVQRLAEAGMPARALDAQAVVLATPCPVQQLPGFDDGWVSVQDLSAQRAAPLLVGSGAQRLPAGARVLDACAAPGGKTAHLLELADLAVTALDQDAQRLQRVDRTLQRLHLQATLQVADAADTARWWDGQPFDAILLDAPCSASGIVRRHPDVRWLRRPDDIGTLVRSQARLLDALWPLLAPGGRLLYATCSIFRAEGQQQIDAFLQRTMSRQPRLEPASPGHLLGLPDNSPGPSPTVAAVGDGFYYALITATG